MRIIINGYPYIYQRQFKTFEYFPDDFELIFVLPKKWKAKKGKVVYNLPVTHKNNIKIFSSPAYFYHSQYPLIGGILKGWQPFFPWLVRKIMKEGKVDLIYSACEPNLLSILYNGLTAKLFKIKHVVFSWENVPYKEKFKGIKLRIFEWIIKKQLAVSQGLICGNHKAAVIYNGYDEKIAKLICPISGVDIDLFQPAETSNETDKITFIFTGALEKRKGVFLIIEAFAELRKKYFNLNLIFCGAGEDEDELKRKVMALGLNEAGTFHKWLSTEKIAEITQQADVFLYPSLPEKGWEEQFGYSMAEASACGLPVIATKTGSIDEVVLDGKTGVLIEPNKEEALKQAMEKFILDKELGKEMGKEGRRHIVDNFSNQKVAAKMADFFLQLNNK